MVHFTGLSCSANLFGEVFPVREEPLQPLLKARQLLDDLVLENETSKQRNQAHHRSHAHGMAMAGKPGEEGGREKKDIDGRETDV